jgi:hypothetical protein
VLFHAGERDAGPLGDDLVMMSSALTVTTVLVARLAPGSMIFSTSSVAMRSWSRKAAASSNCWARMASSFCFRISSISLPSRSLMSGGRVMADAGARAGLVHHVDGLVGQEAVVQVAGRQLGRGAMASSVMVAWWCAS